MRDTLFDHRGQESETRLFVMKQHVLHAAAFQQDFEQALTRVTRHGARCAGIANVGVQQEDPRTLPGEQLRKVDGDRGFPFAR